MCKTSIDIKKVPMRVGSLCLTALMWLLAIPGLCAQDLENRLTVPHFEGSVNRTVSVPVYLDNDQEVVAAQFDLNLPFAIPEDGVPTLVNSRSNMHSVSLSKMKNQVYRVVVMSMQNNAIRGNSGLLLRIPMSVVDDGQTSYTIKISDIVLTDRQGNNIATKYEATGEFAISSENRPDLVVTDIKPGVETAVPGETLPVSYTVGNAGTAATGGGWTEKIYIESVATGQQTYLGTLSYQDALPASGTVQRNATFSLPQLAHMDGVVRLFVQLEPTAATGELQADQGNNSGYSTTTFELSKQLYLTSDRTTVTEGGSSATMTLSRSGDWNRAETFQFTSSVPGLFARNGTGLPCTVTIPAGSSGVSFRLSAVDDAIVRARQARVQVEEAHGYAAVGMDVARVDNDRNPLSLKLSSSEIAEGDALKLTITRGGELTDTLRLTVACSSPLRFTSPITVTILPGKTLGEVIVEAIHDEMPQLDANVRFSVSAPDYATSSATVRLTDPDRPSLTLTLSPSVVSENAGTLTATVWRDRGLEHDAVVRVVSSSSEVYVDNTQVRIPAGEDHADFIVRLKDNAIVDGSRTCQLTAALNIAAQQTMAPEGDRAYTQARLTMTDDESPYLTLSSSTSSVAEGSSTSLTLHRYVPSTASSLTVTMVSTDVSLTVPATVTIPAGRTETTFTVTAQRNTTEGDDRQVDVRATATGLEPAQVSLRVTDRTLPDATCPAVGTEADVFYAGLPATVWVDVHNDGTSILPAGVTIDFYLATSSSLGRYVSSTLLASAVTPEALTPGQTQRWSFPTTVPQGVGNRWIYARLNSNAAVVEFSTSNNLSPVFVPVYVAAPFSVASIAADKESYLPGETAVITGQMQGLLAGQTVRVTLDGSGQYSYDDVQIDAEGCFNAYVRIDRAAQGMLTVQACALGQTEAAKTIQVNVYNLNVRSSESRLSLNENYPYNGKLILRNTSGKSINDIALSHSVLPYGCVMELGQHSTSLQAGMSMEIPFTILPQQSMTGSKYEPITVTASCGEGVSAETTLYYYCHATSSNLVFEPGRVNTTVLLNGYRTYDVKVVNRGLKETGPIMMTVPDDVPWLASLSPSTLPSIKPGKSTTLSFQLTYQQGMHSGDQVASSVLLVPESGAARGLNIGVTITGTEYSRLDVYATDVYTEALGDYSHVSMAQVSVKEARTGRHVMTGVTDGAGHWMTPQLTQGVYTVEISALRHRTVRQQLVIGPGEDKQMTFWLPYQAVLTDFVVEQDGNDYYLTSYVDVDRNAPQAIVLPTLAEAGFECGTDTVGIVMTNVGTYPAQNPVLVMPEVAGVQFTWLNDFPAMLYPQETHVARLCYQGPENGKRRLIASLQMRYGFTLQGETHSETDLYQSLVGCSREDERPPVVLPEPDPVPDEDPETPSVNPGGDDDDNDDDGGADGDDGNRSQPQGVGTRKTLPTYNSSFELFFDDVRTVLTGQPLKATLKVVNGQEVPLTALRFTPVVEDELDADIDATTFFDITEGAVSGFTSDGRYLALSGNSEGSMELQFLPSEDAAPDGSRTYYIGGQLGYRSGSIYTSASLAPVMVTVTPMGEVHLTYLIQRQFVADDPQTDQVETAEPAQFTLLAHNRRDIPVKALSINTQQPQLLADADGMPVRYTSLLTSLNGQEDNLSFADFRLDSLAGVSSAVGRWFYASERSAHVASVQEVAASAQTVVGSTTRVIIEGASELVRAVASSSVSSQEQAPAIDADARLHALATADAYLLNLIEDEENLPDRVMTADAETHELENVSTSTTISGTSGTYTLRVQARQAGWVYGRLHDPTSGMMLLEKVVRQRDGRTVSAANFWQTDRTILADHSSINENILHFADSISETEESYELYFVSRPGQPVQVMAVNLFDEDGAAFIPDEPLRKRVARAEVQFTQPIMRLYNSGFMLSARGTLQDQNLTTVTSDAASSTWSIDLTQLPAVPGNHELKILAAKVKDKQRQPGEGTFTVQWTEQLDGTAFIDLAADPDSTYGTVDSPAGLYPYGEHLFTALPAEGYEFGRWTENGVSIANEPALTYDVWQDAALRAVFFRRTCQITVECNDTLGRLTGNATGIYPWGEELVLTAVPLSGYTFEGWTCDSVPVAQTQTIRVKVQGDAVYRAQFKLAVPVGLASDKALPLRHSDIYDLTGRCLRRRVTDVSAVLRTLPRGIYIVEGRKVTNSY